MENQAAIEVKENKMFVSKDGQPIRCLRAGKLITSFAIAEGMLIEGPTENLGVFFQEAGLVPIKESEYKRRVVAVKTSMAKKMKAAQDKTEYTGTPMTEYAEIEHMQLPAIETVFTQLGGFAAPELRDEQVVLDEQVERSRVTNDVGAKPAITYREHEIAGDATSIDFVLRNIAMTVHETMETHWCPELRNCLVDLENAILWLEQRRTRLTTTTSLADATDQDLENIAGDEALMDNVTELKQ